MALETSEEEAEVVRLFKEGGEVETRRTAGNSGPGKCGVRVSSEIVFDLLRTGGSSGLLVRFGVELGLGVLEFEPPLLVTVVIFRQKLMMMIYINI
mgnify:CR=1 FL=1